MPLAPKCLCGPDGFLGGEPNPECPQHGLHPHGAGIEDPDARIAATTPLLLNAIYFLGEAKKLRHLVEGDSLYSQSVLSAAINLKYAIESLDGALALLAILVTNRSNRLKEIREALLPSQSIGMQLHRFPDDVLLISAYWMIFDRLVLPQIPKLWEEFGPEPRIPTISELIPE